MSLITTKDGRIVIKKADSLMVVPYVFDNSVGDYVLGSYVYDLSAIIGDSIVLEQKDGDVLTKSNEFKSDPLIECASGLRYSFTAQCIDLQNSVLKALFAAMTVSDLNGAAAFEPEYTLVYALIGIRFKGSDLPDVVLPKVKINSHLLISQLKTNVSQCNFSGVCLAKNVAIENLLRTKCEQFSVASSGGTTYTPLTPVLFVPQKKRFLVYKQYFDNTTDLYSYINFSNGSVRDITVNPSNGNLIVQ